MGSVWCMNEDQTYEKLLMEAVRDAGTRRVTSACAGSRKRPALWIVEPPTRSLVLGCHEGSRASSQRMRSRDRRGSRPDLRRSQTLCALGGRKKRVLRLRDSVQRTCPSRGGSSYSHFGSDAARGILNGQRRTRGASPNGSYRAAPQRVLRRNDDPLLRRSGNGGWEKGSRPRDCSTPHKTRVIDPSVVAHWSEKKGCTADVRRIVSDRQSTSVE